MYRPTKRKLVRRVSAASIVAVLAAAGVGITFIAQSGATTTAIGAVKDAAENATTATTTTKSTTATTKYHVVGASRHNDSRSSDDN
jgi:hypothetical protein